MHKLAAELKQCLWQATDSVTILTGTLLSMEVMEVLCLLPQNGVAVEITIDSQAEVLLQSHRGCLHRCYMLADKGASLYLSPTAVEGLWCFLDYKDMIFVDQEGLLHYHSREDAPSLIQQKLMAYQQIKQHASPYLYEYQDMSIHVSVSEHHVLKGDVVELNWQVTHADKVIVKGLGEVASHGSKRIQVQEDTLIKIGAYNSKQVRLQAFPIWVYKEAILQYDLFFMNSATMQYHSLVNHELFPHVYGVALGSKLRLSWQIPEASTLS
ncbi:MAG TPA: hypothetical protein VL947_04200, partial [Cytophagales bacterium]|nr:hypothetical protein [Cytophagales bacterium]